MSDERINLEDELGAYLLGALSPEEGSRVEELLETSESARERIRYLKPAVDLLGEAVELRDPPPSLRDRILAEVEADAPEPVLAARAKAARPKRRPWFSFGAFSLQPAIALAAVLLVAVVGVVGYEVGTGGSGSGKEDFNSPTAQLTVNGDSGTLQLTNFAATPPNQDYQAWVKKDGKVLPSSLFAVRKNGTASAAIPHDLEGADAVVVTAEPKGGSRSPTGPVLASVKLNN